MPDCVSGQNYCVVSNWSSAEKDKNGDVFAWLLVTFPCTKACTLFTHSFSFTHTDKIGYYSLIINILAITYKVINVLTEIPSKAV